MRPWLQCFGLLSSLLWVSAALAAQSATVQGDHLAVQLVSRDSQAAPGTTTVVGVRLEHEPHWHTYWINPGDSGLGTRLSWQLPAGVTAAEIDWPAPRRIPVGPLTNFGYDGEMLLPVRITLPSNLEIGSSVALQVKVNWLVCEEECIPGDAVLELALLDCNAAGVTGAAVTPFVLGRIGEATAGRSVPANLALAENNASVAAEIAVAISAAG